MGVETAAVVAKGSPVERMRTGRALAALGCQVCEAPHGDIVTAGVAFCKVCEKKYGTDRAVRLCKAKRAHCVRR